MNADTRTLACGCVLRLSDGTVDKWCATHLEDRAREAYEAWERVREANFRGELAGQWNEP